MTTVVVGGLGAVGTLFSDLLRGVGPVVVVDRATPGDREPEDVPVLLADARRPPPSLTEVLRAASTIVVALPEDTALDAVAAFGPSLRPGTLVVDTLSVKSGIVPALTDLVRRHDVEALSLNPMFAPDLGFAGNPVAAVTVGGPGPAAAAFLDLLVSAEARVVRVTGDDHDRMTAVSQAATHAAVLAFGRVVAASGLEPGLLLDLAPPPHRTLLALLARITGANPEVYWDIQAGNPGAERARAALVLAVEELQRFAATGADADFHRWVGEVAEWLKPAGPSLREHCGRLFAVPARTGRDSCG